MPSTPLIASSIGVATVSAMTLGLAPGYCARTTTDGGTTSGYSEIGIAGSASTPIRKISIDSTPAKIGRSMKNLDRFMAFSNERSVEFVGFYAVEGFHPHLASPIKGEGHERCSSKPSPSMGEGWVGVNASRRLLLQSQLG